MSTIEEDVKRLLEPFYLEGPKYEGGFTRYGHCIAVERIVRKSGLPKIYWLIALLHDYVEDSTKEGVSAVDSLLSKYGLGEVSKIVKEYFTEDKTNEDKIGRKVEIAKRVYESGDRNLMYVLIADKMTSSLVMSDTRDAGREGLLSKPVSNLLISLGTILREFPEYLPIFWEVKNVIFQIYDELSSLRRASKEDFERELTQILEEIATRQ